MMSISAAVTPAWHAFQSCTPVRITPIRNADHYDQVVALMNALIEDVGDNESHPNIDLLDLVSQLVADYEAEHVDIPDAPPAAVLRYLMTEGGLAQADLKAELGSQSVVSEILSGRRKINVRQAKALAERFRVSPSVFI